MGVGIGCARGGVVCVLVDDSCNKYMWNVVE